MLKCRKNYECFSKLFYTIQLFYLKKGRSMISWKYFRERMWCQSWSSTLNRETWNMEHVPFRYAFFHFRDISAHHWCVAKYSLKDIALTQNTLVREYYSLYGKAGALISIAFESKPPYHLAPCYFKSFVKLLHSTKIFHLSKIKSKLRKLTQACIRYAYVVVFA